MKTKAEKVVLSPKKNPISLVHANLHEVILHLRAINHTVRQNIINLLIAEGAMSVTQIYLRLRTDQSVTSQHLTMLYKSGIVSRQRMGKSIYYSVETARLAELAELIKTINTR
jgi:DNA-binding transcriptional ArsR family regulator